jgi:acetylornithine/succinyldiaminopimelate/putrescine aminotransferase
LQGPLDRRSWFGFEHDDILVIGKAIGAGLPVSAVVTTQKVETGCQPVLRHVQSHQNDPFSGRIAATVISILQEERLVEQTTDPYSNLPPLPTLRHLHPGDRPLPGGI